MRQMVITIFIIIEKDKKFIELRYYNGRISVFRIQLILWENAIEFRGE